MLPKVGRLLYAGYLDVGETSEMRCRALASLGYEVIPVELGTGSCSSARSFVSKVARKLRRPIDWRRANDTICALGPSASLIWIDKGLTIRPSTFRFLRSACSQIRVIGYSPDDMTVPWNTTPQFFRTLSMYDAYVTTKSYGVTELTALGARKVVFSPNGFDPLLHRPCSDAQGNHPPRDIDIGFIGAYEAERARSILSLCNAGLRVSVYGSGWEHLRSRLPGFLTVNSSVMGPMYAQSLCRFRIALGFLRKINRDLQTTRSVEIPACGVFMLAERSEEHRGLFREGLEADYFGSDEELITKARYYLQEPVVRERIAAAGRERAVNGRYSYAWRLVDVLRELQIEPPHLPAE